MPACGADALADFGAVVAAIGGAVAAGGEAGEGVRHGAHVGGLSRGAGEARRQAAGIEAGT